MAKLAQPLTRRLTQPATVALNDALGLGTGGNPLAGLSPSVLAAWYDPSDPASVTLSGGNVISLADKSGNARDMATSTGTVTLGAIGARNALSFAATQRMATAAFLHPAEYMIFAVLTTTTIAAGAAMAVAADNSSGVRHAQYLRRSADVIQSVGFSSGGASNAGSAGSFVANTPALCSAVRTTTAVTARKNGVAGADAAVAAGSARTVELVLGAQSTISATTWSGLIGEVALVASNDPTLRQQIEAYLIAKWAIA